MQIKVVSTLLISIITIVVLLFASLIFPIFSVKEIPFSTVFILVLAALISLMTTLVNRTLTDPEKSKSWRREIAEWNKELREAQRSKDKKAIDKAMKKQQYIMQLQSKMMWQSMKVSLLFIVPLFIMWQVLGSFYTNSTGAIPIAYFPGIGTKIAIPILGAFPSLLWWYLLCSLLFGTIFSHALRLVEVSE